MFRSMIENATHNLVIRRHLPARFGGRSFYASTEGGLKLFHPRIAKADPVLLETAVAIIQRGDVVWDVGANVGLFSFAASGLAGERGAVFAIEPDTRMVDLLRRSSSIAGFGKAPVRVLPVAVSSSNAVAHLRIARRSRAMNYLAGYGTPLAGAIRDEQTVVTVTLDWLLEKILAPTVLKIDTEGAEVEVLRGATDVLKKHRPKIFCEVSKHNAREVSKILFENRYELFDATRPDEPVDIAAWNTLALPVS